MKKIILLVIILLGTVLGVVAQQQAPLSLPANFDHTSYHQQKIVFKLKSEEEIPTQAKFAKPLSTLHPKILSAISDSLPVALFSEKHYLFQGRGAAQMSQAEKQLSLIYGLTVREGVNLIEAINLLRNDPAVAYAEPVYVNYQALALPNDPLLAANQQYHLTKIRAFEAWEVATGNPDFFIGITDNGCNINNADLADNVRFPIIIDSPDDLKNDLSGASAADPNDADNNVIGGGHGDVVALCSSAVPNNGIGTAGTGYNCKFLPVKVAADDNLGFYTEGYQGILYAAKQGAQVINMSWGRRGFPSAFEQNIIEVAYQYVPKKIVLVAAAGNDNTTDFFYPATYKHVLSVAATESNDFKASFSTFNHSVDLAAPGQNIRISSGGGASGTSFASPLVAGAAILLRAKYPEWNAEQVIARLKTTTDDLYAIPENAPYIDQLGTGRLNMARAFTAPLKAVTLDQFEFSEGQRGFVFSNTHTNFITHFTNQLDALENLSITLQVNSSHITIQNPTWQVGTVAANTAFNNTSSPFMLYIKPSTPANTIVEFSFTYQAAGGFSYTEKKRVLINPGHLDINQVLFSVNDKGNLAIKNKDFSVLSGFSYTYPEHLTEAGLMIATSSNQISDAVRNEFNQINQDFSVEEAFRPTAYMPNSYLETQAVFNDIDGNTNRMGIQVRQKTYSWNEPTLNKGHVVEYRIRNLNSTRIDSLYAAIFANWNIYDAGFDRAGWIEEQKLAFVRDAFGGSIFAGIQLLTPQDGINFYAFDDLEGINFKNGLTDQEKFEVMSGGIQRTEAGTQGNGTDVAHSLGVKIKNLNPGPGKTLVFVFAAGNNLSQLRENSKAIADRYIALNTAPRPTVATINACAGQSVTIQPSNGLMFRFYNANPNLTGTILLHTGSSFTLNNLQGNQTLFITNIDQIFESEALELQISPALHNSSFEMSASSIDLAQGNLLQLTATSIDAVAWNWEITREGETPNASVTFVNGTNAQTQNPSIVFLNNGSYSIKLTSQNTQMCSASTTKMLTVTGEVSPTSLTAFAKQLIEVYPNPIEDKLWINVPQMQENLILSITDSYGKVYYQGELTPQALTPRLLRLPSLAVGLYFLKIANQVGEQKVFKLVRK